MAINRSDVAHIVQQAAIRMNLSLETEQEILESLSSECNIKDVWQLHHISLDHWKSMGAPTGFLANLEACLEEAGFAKDGKVKTKRRKSAKGFKAVSMNTPRSSGNSKNASGRSGTRKRNSSRSNSRDAAMDNSNRSTRSNNSERLTSSAESRQAALVDLKGRLRAETKQGLAQIEFDAKGNKIYEWDQNNSCVLLYVTWPFEFEFGPSTKFKCTISKDTILLKAKHKSGQKSLRYTTGGLVNTLHSEWCVVSKGKDSGGGDGQAFAIEVALFKKNVGVEWTTALIAKHIGTSHMSPDQIRDELKSYGLDPEAYKSNDELLKALRMARAKGNSNFSAMGPNRPNNIGRSHSADDVNLYDGPKSPGSLSNRSPGSLSSSKRSLRRARSTSADRPLVADTSVNKFSEGQIVYYTSSDGKQERAKIIKIYLDDELVPFYDIRLTESAKEKQTTDSHLSRLTDDLFADSSAHSNRSASAHSGNSSNHHSQPPQQASPVTPSNPVPQKSRFMENQVVYYTNNDQKEKAKILKIHLDDELIPFYDIRLLDSGNEKQTTDSRLSSLTDDLFKAAAQGQPHGSELPGTPVRKLPGRSHSMDAAGVAGASLSPGPLKKGRRGGRRESSAMLSSTTLPAAHPPMARATSDGQREANGEQRPSNPVPQKSRFMENQVVYYTNNDQKEKAKILKIHLDDELIPFYDIRLLDSGNEKQTTDSRLSSLTDDLFKAAAQGRPRSDSYDGSELPGTPVRKLPGRSHSMDAAGMAGASLSPGPLKKGRRGGRRESSAMPASTTLPAAHPPMARATSDGQKEANGEHRPSNTTAQKSRFMEKQVVYYTNNGQKEKAKILKIHLDDELVPFYDIRLLDSGNEKQTTDSRLSSLTDDLFQAAAQGSALPGPPERKTPDRSRSMGSSGVAGASMSPGPLKKGRRNDRRQSRTMPTAPPPMAPSAASRSGSVGPGPERMAPGRSRSMGSSGVAGGPVSPGPLKKGRRSGNRASSARQVPSTGNIANIKKELGGYGGMSPSTYNYASEGEMIAAWRFIQEDSKLSVGRLKKELRDLGQSTEYIEKKEMIGALCKARLEQKRGGADKLGGSDRAEQSSSGEPGRYKVQRRNSDGPLGLLRQGKRRGGARGK